MKTSTVILALLLTVCLNGAWLKGDDKPAASQPAPEKKSLQMSLADAFVVADTDEWTVTVEKLLPLRFADVSVKPKKGTSFDMMLYFKCDTPDLAQFDTPVKMKKAVEKSSLEYLSEAVGKELKLKEIKREGTYGFYVVLTDKRYAGKADVPQGEFRYLIRGMVRLSPDSALGFSLMTNELGTPGYQRLFDYILSFVKEIKRDH